MKTPRFTDADLSRDGYVSAEESRKPNYLRNRFKAIRARQQEIAAEAKAKVAPLKKVSR